MILRISRRKLIAVIVVVVIVAVLIGLPVSLYIHKSMVKQEMERRARNYVESFRERVGESGISINPLSSNITVEDAKNIATEFVKYYARLKGYNSTIKRVDLLQQSTKIHGFYKTYLFHVETGNGTYWSVEVEGVKGMIVSFYVPRPRSQSACVFKKINESYAYGVVLNVLRTLNYTVVDDPNVEVVVLNISYSRSPLGSFIKITYTYKVYGYLVYDPLLTSRENYVNIDACDLEITAFSINPTILLLYEENMLKPLKKTIDKDTAVKNAVEYIKTCMAIRDNYIENYTVKKVIETWYFADLYITPGPDTISIGYLVELEIEYTVVRESFLGIPTSSSKETMMQFIIVDAQTGIPAYIVIEIARPELCTKTSTL